MKLAYRKIGWGGRFVFLAIVFTLVMVSEPSIVQAQDVVVARIKDKTRRKKMGKRITRALRRALRQSGANLVPYYQYLEKARSAGIRKQHATRPDSISQVASELGVAGVVTGVVRRKKWRYIIRIRYIDAAGNLIWKRVFRPMRSVFGQNKALLVADQVMKRVQPVEYDQESDGSDFASTDQGQVDQFIQEDQTQQFSREQPEQQLEPVAQLEQEPAPAPEPPQQESSEQIPAQSTDSGSSGNNLLPAWARNTGAESKSQVQVVRSARKSSSSSSSSSTRLEKTPFNDLLISVGGSLHIREGLRPVHKAMFFPGVRVDAHLFLGAFTDIAFFRNIGIAGMYDRSLFLEYATDAASSANPWKAQQVQWRGELIYRIPFSSLAFLLRGGFSSTTCVIAGGTNSNALSVEYLSPYGNLDMHIKFADAFRFFLSAGAMINTAAYRSVTGAGMGLNFAAGINMTISDLFHLGIGYEWLQYKIKDDADSGLGEFFDTFQSAFIRLGYNYR